MAQVRISPQALPNTGLTPVMTAGLLVADTHLINNDGRVYLLCTKGAGTCDVTIQTPGTVDSLAVADRVVTIPANATKFLIPLGTPDVYNQPGTHDTYVTFSEVTGLTVAAIRY